MAIVPFRLLVYIGEGDDASWMSLVLTLCKLASSGPLDMHLMVSEGVTATTASTTPAHKPASIVRAGVSLPCTCQPLGGEGARGPTSGFLRISLIESYVMNLTPAFSPLPAMSAPEPAYMPRSPCVLTVSVSIVMTPRLCEVSRRVVVQAFWFLTPTGWPFVVENCACVFTNSVG
jgi:hypothetical protein